MTTRILILGDLYPNNIKVFPKLPENDFCVANLECSITTNEKNIKKDGPSLKIIPAQAEILKTLDINLVGLANNHVFDYGSDGLNSTIMFLEKNDISYAGHSSSCSSFIKNINGMRFGFYFVSEHQYNYFADEGIGVNLLETDRCFDDVIKLKSKTDFVFVLFHGGKEYYEYPTPNQQSICHKFVDSGADVVICQHSHCIGCEEKYKKSTILYGQGNFAFPFRENKHFKSGLVVEALINDDKSVSLNYIPVIHENPGVIEIATKDKAIKIMDNFINGTKTLSNESSTALYDLYVDQHGLDFLYKLFNKSKFYIRLDTSRFFKNRMLKRYVRRNQKYLLYLYNYFNCETHREYIKKILNKQVETGSKR